MVCSAMRRLRFFLSLERISKKFVQSNPGIAAAIIMVTSDAQSSINRVARGLTAPSSHTTVRMVPYTAVHTRGANLPPGVTLQNS